MGREVRLIDPDCRDGKHRACIGTAWSEIKDQVVECECSCHSDEGESDT